MQRKMVGALVGVLALGVTACGDGSEPVSRAELRVQASAVCRDVTRHVLAIQARATQATMSSSLTRAADVMSDGLERLEAIEPPDALADRYERFLAWKGAQRDAARELAEPGGRMSARSKRAVDAHESPVWTLAQGLGLRGCT